MSKLTCNNSTFYLNPLDIPTIVKIIFNNVNSLTTLKNIRAVNKLWRWESMDQLKRNAVLFLNGETVEGLVNAYLNKKEEEQPEGDFKSFFYQISERPFESYRVPHDDENAFTSLPDSSTSLLKSAEGLIWDVYFSRATFLDLGMIYFDNNTDIYAGFEELKWILKKCPKLKALDIDPHIVPEDNFDEDDDYNEREHHVHSHMRGNQALETAQAEGWGNDEILAPNLESLSVGKSFDAYNSHLYSLLRKEGRAITTFRRLLKGCPKLKNLWTHATNNFTRDNSPVLKAATDTLHELESLTLVSLPWREYVSVDQVADYVKTVRPPLKTLILTIDWSECLDRDLVNVLKVISGTLTKLELFLDSNKPRTGYTSAGLDFLRNPEKHKIDPTKTSWNLSQPLQFPNLTHLKISLCYTRFEGKGKDNLLEFEFGSFARMKKLKEFRYESGLNVEKSWVTKQVTVRDLPVFNEEQILPDLKLFHYHKKFSCSALQRLGEWMPGLETLEVVLDREMFQKVLKVWPGLKRIILLPCSDVPKEVYERTIGPVIVDQSENYTPAERKSPDKTRLFGEDCDHDRRRLSCFRMKAHNAVNY